MEVGVIASALDALQAVADPFRLMLLALGVLMGLFLGIVPGIGGLVGMALLLPFTFTMDAYAAFAILLGMSAVTNTSDTIPAVLFGVPGTAGAQATVLDGNPMAKNGAAGRALSAAFSASLIGGLVGAVLLALTVPILRPLMLYIASPELLGFAIFGIAMVSVLSGTAPLRGLIAAGVGILLSMVGADSQTGTLRYTMGSLYLWDGLPLVPLVLGVFALPELADLAIKRSAISDKLQHDTHAGMRLGLQDTLRNWRLAMRGGALGAMVGAIPGLGSSIVDWIAYAWAAQTTKDSDKTFGKGDVRGVIAPESANNALTAGALVPTIAFGVPGSASMAILLGVFMIHGLVPGPDMLTRNLDITYGMIWSIGIANILGAGICFAFSGYLARIALLRFSLILPAVLIFVFIGAFQATRSWGDLYALLVFAVIGWTMKQMRWPRPPLVLGFVLGALIERYMFISTMRYGADWLMRPLVIVLLVGAVFILVGPFRRHIKSLGGVSGIVADLGMPRFSWTDVIPVLVIGSVGYMVVTAWSWPWGSQIGPLMVGAVVLVLATISLVNQVFTRGVAAARKAAGTARDEVHMDTVADFGDIGMKVVAGRALRFLAYLLGFMGLLATIGILPGVPVFAAAFMRIEGRERWRIILRYTAGMVAIIYVVFDRLLGIPWPPTLMGAWFPALQAIPTV